MKSVMVMYDSLRLDMLPCYGGKEVELPNFKRLAEHTIKFENNYVCSLPCMPARRELHTGRPNFLHRAWGPMEPFDDSMPEILKKNGIYSRIVTDHNHYVEDGGGTYLPRYSTWECNRGQEGDPWAGSAAPVKGRSPHTLAKLDGMPPAYQEVMGRLYHQDEINRQKQQEENDYPQAMTFSQGIEFIQNNYQYDNWFLQIETFDPHEPFNAPGEYIAKVFDPDTVSQLDWPPYSKVKESPEVVAQVRKKYLALLCFCDACLGKVLDEFDAHDLWKDTQLIVNTDHGYLLGEHDWWAKSMMPDYQEVAHTPLFIWDPRYQIAGKSRNSLVQTIDLAPTILEFFGLDIPKDMQGKPLSQVLKEDKPVREYGIFGSHSGVISITDGRYILMTAPKNQDVTINNYTLMTTHMRARMSVAELQQATLSSGFSFTKGCPVLKVPASHKTMTDLPVGQEILFDVLADPKQTTPINDAVKKAELRQALIELLQENEAPAEIYEYYGLN